MGHCEILYYFSISVTTVGVHIDKPCSLLVLQNRERDGEHSSIDVFVDLRDLCFWHCALAPS